MGRIVNIIKQTVGSKLFTNFIFILILLAALITGLETYPVLARRYSEILHFADRFIILFFTIEIILKIISNSPKPWNYFRDPWNVFDFLIVAVCLIPVTDTHFFAVLRIVRVLRILRMITIFPKLRMIIGALLKSIPSMGYIILLISLLFFVYAVIGVFSFGPSDPVHFGDLHHALVTLFKVLTLEGWTDIMNVHVYGTAGDGDQQIIALWPFLYFASFILIGAMIIMNLFIGVIMNSMEESQNELSGELKTLLYKEKNGEELYKLILSRLDELNREIQQLRNEGSGK